MSAVAKTTEAAEPPVENIIDGFTNGLAWSTHEFRDVTYKVTELSIGEYDDIVKKATRKEKIRDENGVDQEIEVLDNTLQSRMMLKACVVEPEKVDITKLGTRLTLALNGIVNRLHYGIEPDALRQPKKADDDEDKKPGNG
jgi:hypothetical protein